MKKTSIPKNENGSVTVLALIMVVLLALLGMAVTRTSSVEVQVAANETQAVQDLYQAESGDHFALETSGTWMDNPFLTSDETAANSVSSLDVDGDGNNDVNIEIRCIEITGTSIGTLSPEANDLPLQQHISVPPVESGYSLKYFEVRRYGITATSIGRNTRIQLGAYKVFNKF